MRPSSKAMRALALGIAVATLSGCSEYLDRRDTIAQSGGDAAATNMVTQMVDPWPAASANKSIGFSGTRMEAAVDRYNTNRTYAPQGIGTSGTYSQQPTAPANNTTPLGPTVTQPAAPVK